MSECFAPAPRLTFLFFGLLRGRKSLLAADFEADVADGLLVRKEMM